MDPNADMKKIFFQECDDLLIEMENGLIEMDQSTADSETVNAVFRAVHSIKGGAGAFGLDALVSFAHVFETTLDAVRSDALDPTPDVMRVLLSAGDVLADLSSSAQTGDEVDPAAAEEVKKALAEFVETEESEDEAAEAEIDFAPMSLDLDFDDDDDDEGFFDAEESDEAPSTFEILFTPEKSLYARANDPLRLFRNLTDLGDLEVNCNWSKLPSLEEMDPEQSYLTWSLMLQTENDKDEIAEVFDFVEDDCELSIRPVHAIDVADTEPEALEEEPVDLPTADEPEEVAEADASETVAADNVADIKPQGKKPDPAPVVAAPSAAKRKEPAQTTIRVSLDRIERLVNLTGELVINQAMLVQCNLGQTGEVAELMDSGLEELKQLTREVQESVMSIRAQPVSTLFQRMSRIVREAGHATGKTIRLVTEGEATEVDKTIIERLADPLTHMIRNAVDHGLELPEKRVENGKPAEGVIVLSAAHRSGRVLIEVKDDGAGINRGKVRQIALEKGLIAESDQLSDNDVDNLLFMPGFSTATEVSNLSGRGVGMDVVRSAIQAVGGKISITSVPGEGSTFAISLPLTLAILDGMIVESAEQVLVVPLTTIVETLKPTAEDLHPLGSGSNVISVRGELIPIIDVAEVMGYRDQPVNPLDGVVLSVETENGKRAALLVDRIQDQRQVVIKSLEENFGSVESVAAATILGDGRIALIVDVDAILGRTRQVAPGFEPRLAAAG